MKIMVTSQLEMIQRELEQLPPEKLRVVAALLSRLISEDDGRGIERKPDVCGGEPCIVRTRIPVWVLEETRRQGATDGEMLRAYPTLTADDLMNAWTFVELHREEIESQIRENQDA